MQSTAPKHRAAAKALDEMRFTGSVYPIGRLEVNGLIAVGGGGWWSVGAAGVVEVG